MIAKAKLGLVCVGGFAVGLLVATLFIVLLGEPDPRACDPQSWPTGWRCQAAPLAPASAIP